MHHREAEMACTREGFGIPATTGVEVDLVRGTDSPLEPMAHAGTDTNSRAERGSLHGRKAISQ